MSSQIMLYTGPGADPTCIYAAKKALQTHIDGRLYRVTDCNSLMECIYSPQSTTLILFPGGNLNELTNHHHGFPEEIKDIFHRTTAKYNIACLGICMGAMVLSQSIFPSFQGDIGFSNSSYSFGLLEHVPVKMLAPIFPKTQLPSIDDFRIASIYNKSINQMVKTPHLYGPGFLDAQLVSDLEILATYSELPRLHFGRKDIPGQELHQIVHERMCEAIFYKTSTTPSTLLASSHFEIDSEVVNSEIFFNDFPDFTRQKQSLLVETVKESDAFLKKISKAYFEKVGLVCMQT